jgi:hypothetical protein
MRRRLLDKVETALNALDPVRQAVDTSAKFRHACYELCETVLDRADTRPKLANIGPDPFDVAGDSSQQNKRQVFRIGRFGHSYLSDTL